MEGWALQDIRIRTDKNIARRVGRIMVRYWRHRGKEIFKRLEPHIDKYFPYHKPELDRVSGEKAYFTGKRVRAPFDLALGQVVPFGQQLTASHPEIVK
ncbi:hypothetical protein X801_07976, partial [Opisthorchis viverrini]